MSDFFSFTNENESLPLLKQRDHLAFKVTIGKVPPPMPGGLFLLPDVLRSFFSKLQPAHMTWLDRFGLTEMLGFAKLRIEWSLIGAAVERWNPLTNTFFFNPGEHIIFKEEVCPLLSIPSESNLIRREEFFTAVTTPFRYRFMLMEVLMGADLNLAIKEEALDLHLLAKVFSNLLSSTDPIVTSAIGKGALILVCGVFLFPNGHFTLSTFFLEWIYQCIVSRIFSPSQPVLAYLMEGMSSASRGEPFFGSPYLLQSWLSAHLRGVVTILGRSVSDSGEPLEHRIYKKTRLEWRTFFDRLVCFDCLEPSYLQQVRAPLHSNSECILIGITAFVAYPVHRSSSMIVHYSGLPQPVSYIPRIEGRMIISTENKRRLLDVLTHWDTATHLLQPTSIVSVKYELYREYTQWFERFELTNLATCCEDRLRSAGLLNLVDSSASTSAPAQDKEKEKKRRMQ